MQAVYELATVDAHEPARGRIPAAQWEAYCAGYYRALQMALEVMDLAYVRWRLYLKEQKRRRRQAAAAGAVSTDVGHADAAHVAKLVEKDPIKNAGQRRELLNRENHLDRPIAEAARAGESIHVRARFLVQAPLNISVDDRLGHLATYRLEVSEKQLPTEGGRIVNPEGLPPVVNPSDPCRDTCDRTVADQSSEPAQRKTMKVKGNRCRG